MADDRVAVLKAKGKTAALNALFHELPRQQNNPIKRPPQTWHSSMHPVSVCDYQGSAGHALVPKKLYESVVRARKQARSMQQEASPRTKFLIERLLKTYTGLEAELRLSILKDPEDADAHYDLGLYLKSQGQYEPAETEFMAAIKRDPYHALAHYHLGNILYRVHHDYAAAELEFRAALDSEYNDPKTHFNLAVILHYVNDSPDDAEFHYIASLEMNPFDRDALRELECLYIEKEYTGMEQRLRIAMCRKPEDPNPLCDFGTFLYRNKVDYDGAEEVYRHAIQLKPDYAEPHMLLGILLFKARWLYDMAEAEFETAINLDPLCWRAHYSLGCLLYKGRQDYTGAEAKFLDTLKLKPDDAKTRYNLAVILLMHRGATVTAVDELRTAHLADPKDEEIKTMLKFAQEVVDGQVERAMLGSDDFMRELEDKVQLKETQEREGKRDDGTWTEAFIQTVYQDHCELELADTKRRRAELAISEAVMAGRDPPTQFDPVELGPGLGIAHAVEAMLFLGLELTEDQAGQRADKSGRVQEGRFFLLVRKKEKEKAMLTHTHVFFGSDDEDDASVTITENEPATPSPRPRAAKTVTMDRLVKTIRNAIETKPGQAAPQFTFGGPDTGLSPSPAQTPGSVTFDPAKPSPARTMPSATRPAPPHRMLSVGGGQSFWKKMTTRRLLTSMARLAHLNTSPVVLRLTLKLGLNIRLQEFDSSYSPQLKSVLAKLANENEDHVKVVRLEMGSVVAHVQIKTTRPRPAASMIHAAVKYGSFKDEFNQAIHTFWGLPIESAELLSMVHTVPDIMGESHNVVNLIDMYGNLIPDVVSEFSFHKGSGHYIESLNYDKVYNTINACIETSGGRDGYRGAFMVDQINEYGHEKERILVIMEDRMHIWECKFEHAELLNHQMILFENVKSIIRGKMKLLNIFMVPVHSVHRRGQCVELTQENGEAMHFLLHEPSRRAQTLQDFHDIDELFRLLSQVCEDHDDRNMRFQSYKYRDEAHVPLMVSGDWLTRRIHNLAMFGRDVDHDRVPMTSVTYRYDKLQKLRTKRIRPCCC